MKKSISVEKLSKDIINWLNKNEKKIYASIGVLFLFMLILAAFDFLNVKKMASFLIYIIIGGGLKYLINKYHIWLEFTPIVFFCVLIAKYMGFFWVAAYILIADIVAAFLGGYGPTGGSVPYWLWMFIFPLFAIPFELRGAILLILPLIYFAGGLFIEQFAKGGLNHVRIASSISNFIINLYFFVKLTGFFVGIIS